MYIHIYTSHTHICFPLADVSHVQLRRRTVEHPSGVGSAQLYTSLPTYMPTCTHIQRGPRLTTSAWGNLVFNPRRGGGEMSAASPPFFGKKTKSKGASSGLPGRGQGHCCGPAACVRSRATLSSVRHLTKLSPNTCSQYSFIFLFYTKCTHNVCRSIYIKKTHRRFKLNLLI